MSIRVPAHSTWHVGHSPIFINRFARQGQFEFRDGDTTFMDHYHRFHEFVIIHSGSAVHVVDGAESTVFPGEVFLIHPGMSHHFRDAASLCLTNVMFMYWRLSAAIEELREMPGFAALFVVQPAVSHGGPSVILDAADQQVVRSITDRMLAESGSKPAGYKAALRGLFIELVVLLCRARSAPPDAGDRLAVLVSSLQERLDDRWSLARMADVAGCSIPSLSRHFRRLLGSSPMEYLIALRVARAKELLVHTDLTVTEIAFECGFSDGNYLARQFKQRLGVSPRDYRRGESAPVI